MFDKLDALYCLGAPMFPEENLQAKTALCNNFSQDYGSSLSGPISSLYGSDLEARADTVGRVWPFVVLQIVDADDKVLPLGEAGVVRVRSPGYGADHLWGNHARFRGQAERRLGLSGRYRHGSTTTVSSAS